MHLEAAVYNEIRPQKRPTHPEKCLGKTTKNKTEFFLVQFINLLSLKHV
jgi:hypothetical protein